jgi:hypothetical protein
MTARLLDFAPAAWQAYQRLRAGEAGSRLKQGLEELADDPALVRADARASRCLIIEKQLRQAAQVWGLPVDAPDGAHVLVVWREIGPVIEIGYIGPAPSTRLLQQIEGRSTSVPVTITGPASQATASFAQAPHAPA